MRAISLLAMAAIVFAPAPAAVSDKERGQPSPPTGSLAAQILSPTFDEGVIRAEAPPSVLQRLKRPSPGTPYAVLPLLAFSALLFGARLRASHGLQDYIVCVATSVTTRAPPSP